MRHAGSIRRNATTALAIVACLVSCSVTSYADPAQPSAAGSSGSGQGSLVLAGILAGAGFGVIASGYLLKHSKLETIDGSGFDVKPFLYVGAGMLMFGALVAAMPRDAGEEPQMRMATVSDDGSRAGTWSVSVGPSPGRGVAMMVRTGF